MDTRYLPMNFEQTKIYYNCTLMNCVRFCFDRGFDDLLPPERRGVAFAYHFNGNPSLKHLVEAIHIPHTEVGKVLVNHREASLSYLAQDGDYIDIYPANCPGSREVGQSDENVLNGQVRFILDNHLGKLTTYLRMLGFDALYRNDFQDQELATLAAKEGRVLLTRDRGLLMRRSIELGYYVRSMDARKQAIEVLQRYNLFDKIRPFQRCLRCNHILKPVSKASVLERLEPLTQKYYDEFCVCPKCDRIYWKGSHYDRMQNLIHELRTPNLRTQG